ncbi:hypothetical protein RC74_18635 [Falsihalocynthiibacter arcticus]|uniref:Transcription elongation factor GreA/GreB C-terminal domain-containing protein n=2 Tax=Falsihalocynthiibacter arcticus TaxID=1579316 RepID=A0A126V3W2_9RHOB|nr:hypothetical protein RC74_18635 [Falsihalocynthiibacter arcticus]
MALRVSIILLYRRCRFFSGKFVVAFGAEVDVMAEDDTRRTFRIVGEDEADPAHGLIAPYSPLGDALLSAELGSIVEWRKPAGTVDLVIVAIRFP